MNRLPRKQMTVRSETTLQEAVALSGDPHPLLERVGSPHEGDGLSLALGAGNSRGITTPAALGQFLADYRDRLLIPVELPAMIRAHQHASKGQLRELLELDRSLAASLEMRPFAAASVRVGQRQLNRLRPLRDHRLVQRYRLAIEEGRAHGWHVVVYGVSLAVFSLPLRQGIAAYSQNTIASFIQRAGSTLGLSVGQTREIHDHTCALLPERLKGLLPGVA